MAVAVSHQFQVSTAASLALCLDCRALLGGRDVCPGCRRSYPQRDGILEAMNPLTGRNRIVAEFYEGPSWQRFRPWERLFLAVQGGQKRARWPILRRLTVGDTARVLEVGIGDGDNLALLPPTWEIQGVDLARSRLTDCLRRFPKQAGRLTLAEAERLPFPDATFDACYSVGGFTFFGDHEGALREMRRVTRPGGPVVVADEVPWLCRMGIGHLIGRPEIDAFWMRGLGLNREFLAMVFELQLDLDEIVGSALPGARRMAIWGGLGYCIVHP